MAKKTISWIFRILSWIVYAVIIVSLLLAAPILFGYRPMTVLSGSMEPTYPVGSVVYLKETPFEDLQVGDAITFALGDTGAVATHRIVEINEKGKTFVTKGDANPSNDTSAVSYSDVKGKVSDIAIPVLGYFLSYIRHWYFIAIMAAILIINMLLSSSDENAKKRRVEKRAAREAAVQAEKQADAPEPEAEQPLPVQEIKPEAAEPEPKPEPEKTERALRSKASYRRYKARADLEINLKNDEAQKVQAEKDSNSGEITAAEFFKDL